MNSVSRESSERIGERLKDVTSTEAEQEGCEIRQAVEAKDATMAAQGTKKKYEEDHGI
jgi:hypothetical protein